MREIFENEKIVSTNPVVAKVLGIHAGHIIYQMHYWICQKEEKGENYHDGYYWVYNSYPKWKEQLDWVSERTLQREIRKLENIGVLISGNYNKLAIDKTKWYTINYDKLKEIIYSYQKSKTQNGPLVSHYDKLSLPQRQHDVTMTSECDSDYDKMPSPIPYSTTNNNTNITHYTTSVQPAAELAHTRFEEGQDLYSEESVNHDREDVAVNTLSANSESQEDGLRSKEVSKPIAKHKPVVEAPRGSRGYVPKTWEEAKTLYAECWKELEETLKLSIDDKLKAFCLIFYKIQAEYECNPEYLSQSELSSATFLLNANINSSTIDTEDLFKFLINLAVQFMQDSNISDHTLKSFAFYLRESGDNTHKKQIKAVKEACVVQVE